MDDFFTLSSASSGTYYTSYWEHYFDLPLPTFDEAKTIMHNHIMGASAVAFSDDDFFASSSFGFREGSTFISIDPIDNLAWGLGHDYCRIANVSGQTTFTRKDYHPEIKISWPISVRFEPAALSDEKPSQNSYLAANYPAYTTPEANGSYYHFFGWLNTDVPVGTAVTFGVNGIAPTIPTFSWEYNYTSNGADRYKVVDSPANHAGWGASFLGDNNLGNELEAYQQPDFEFINGS